MQKVVLIFGTEEAKDHWMVSRMFRRAGLDLSTFDKLVCTDGVLDKLNNGPWTAAVIFGEEALSYVHQHTDVLRYFNRVIPIPLNNKTVQSIICLDPQYLLPYQVPDEESHKKKGMRHPPRYQGKVIELLRRSLVIAEKGHTVLPTKYLEDPTPSRFKVWVNDFFQYVQSNPDTILSWDIETPYKQTEDNEEEYDEGKRRVETTILRISFAFRVGEAVSIPWSAEYLEDIRRLLGWTGYHTGHNSVGFDIPVVEVNDVRIGGTMLDGMDAWHLLQTDLDKGLEHVSAFYSDLLPWKHLSDALPALYSCIDSDAALRNILGIIVDLKRVGLWERFLKEMELMVLLREAGNKGNQVDEPFRQELKKELEGLLYDKVLAAQGLVAPMFHRRKLSVRIPKGANQDDYAAEVIAKKVTVCSACGKERVSVKHKCPVSQEWKKSSTTLMKTAYYVKEPFATITNLEQLLSTLKANGFNPCSSHQMKLYMKAHRHPVGQNHKTKKETADVKHLQKLVKRYGEKHPIYAHTLQIRLVQKALSTYVNGLEPDSKGLTYTTYVNSPSTWRLGSRNINVQNLGKRGTNKYAKRARAIIVPRPGHVFVQADSSAIEAVMVGEFMGSESYKRLARKGVHGYVAARKLGWPVTPDSWTMELNDKIKADHKDHYDKYKQVNHGTNYGMGPYLMHMSDPETFPTVRDAQDVQDYIFAELPGLQEWHDQLRMFAKKHGYLDNPWGLRHYFYDVFNYKYDPDTRELVLGANGKPQVRLAKDAKKVIAFKPQSSAGFFMRDNLLLLGRTNLKQYMVPVVSIHDGYTVEVPDEPSIIDYAVETLENILTRPITEMANLRVGCEIGIMRENFLEEKQIKIVEV